MRLNLTYQFWQKNVLDMCDVLTDQDIIAHTMKTLVAPGTYDCSSIP